MSIQTAQQVLFIYTGLEAKAREGVKGKQVFVTTTSRGIGVQMLQLVKQAGAEVIATCSVDNIEQVTLLRVDKVINYTKIDIKQQVAKEENKVNLVINYIG